MVALRFRATVKSEDVSVPRYRHVILHPDVKPHRPAPRKRDTAERVDPSSPLMPSTNSALPPSAPSPAVSALERERLAGLLAALPDGRHWAVAHMHGPLLCALGLLRAPDAGYARAAQRRFDNLAETRSRALALLVELDRDARDERYERRRRERRRVFRFASPSGSAPQPGDDGADELPRSA
jgi:hypothetical protein